MVLLIGNYELDRQHSMQRFGNMMLEGLAAAGVRAELIKPRASLGNFAAAGSFVGKWLAYIDKFVLFPRQLRATLRSAPAVVHICDHSNAMYAQHVRGIPVVVTCHDFLAIRGGLGEATDTPASATGRFLQRWIVAGLQRATALASVSQATADDAKRFVKQVDERPAVNVIPLGLSYPFRQLPHAEAEQRRAKSRISNSTTLSSYTSARTFGGKTVKRFCASFHVARRLGRGSSSSRGSH
jgi:hypothetical protein